MKKLITPAIAVFLAAAVFTAVTSIIWPGPAYPVWAERVANGVFLGILLTVGVVALVAWRSKR